MKFEGLKLLPGIPLQLQFHHTPDVRERSLLVGYLKNKGIVVTTPQINGGSRPVKLGEQLNIRLFSSEANSAVAFSAQTTHVTVSPFPQLYLSYPSSVATGEIRKAVRVSTDLISTIKIAGASLSATIVDLSTSGCRIESPKPLGVAGDRFVMVTKVDAAGLRRIIQLPCEIKVVINESLETDVCSYGLAFEALSEEVSLVLHAYVYYQLRQA
ncbi:flagellar brake protein [Simiduia litorea]|uniref:flagellar brake protein n=1 Tax=Simiduia litorea TaxID=1435348 RepID=UPI0036F3F3DF